MMIGHLLLFVCFFFEAFLAFVSLVGIQWSGEQEEGGEKWTRVRTTGSILLFSSLSGFRQQKRDGQLNCSFSFSYPRGGLAGSYI